jgi:miniconductance mechanosensitive channel
MLISHLSALLESWGLGPAWADPIAIGTALLLLALGAWIVDRVIRRVLLGAFVSIARRSRSTWDDKFVEHEVLHQVAHLVPALVLYSALPIVLAGWSERLVGFLQQGTLIYLIVVVVMAINRALAAALAIYNSTQLSSEVPLRPIVQLMQGLVIFAAVVLLVALLINRSATAILGGMGAFTAVLLLVFQQPILGLTAGVQLSANKLIRRGDWISVPRYGADGTVLDISLTTVSVQNWDMTISSIPAHALLTDTFRNWRGMEDSGGRRIKRSILIDVNSIRFVDEELRQRMGRLQFLREYLDIREQEIEEFNRDQSVDGSSPGNGRRLTNVGSFRAYLAYYLRAHPKVSDTLTFLVRQLDPTPQGLPIEIYVFLTEQRWAEYEEIQADIFDHIFAVIPEFGLRAYQQPSGKDLERLSSLPMRS